MSSGGRARHSRARAAVLLLAATLASLVLTLVAGYLTRLSLVEAARWVSHTEEVKLAIGRAQLALARGDTEALGTSEAEIRQLTIDNRRQQENTTRAAILIQSHSFRALEDLFVSMQSEEDRLMTSRSRGIASAQAVSALAFTCGALLTVAFGIGSFALLRAQRRALAHQQALLEAVVESVDDGILAIDTSRETIAMNAAARAMLGRSFPRYHLPDDWRDHLRAFHEDGAPMPPERGPLSRAIRGETCKDVVYRIERAGEPKTGDLGVWVSTTARPIHDAEGRIVAAVATLRDITEQRANAQHLRDLSLSDEMTGLLNRRGFFATADGLIAAARRARTPLALLYADVDGLKSINDELGHEQGDRVIVDAASVLRSFFRDGDVVARIGGDEFVALLPNFSPGAREPLLDRFATAVRAQIEREPRPYRLSISAGITLMDWASAQSLDELLAEADRNMYSRKRERAQHSAPHLQARP